MYLFIMTIKTVIAQFSLDMFGEGNLEEKYAFDIEYDEI